MNEDLAIRKFKQNIFDEKIRIMALSTEHSSLYNAIAHASEKLEQLKSSNITQTEQRQNTANTHGANKNNNKNTQNQAVNNAQKANANDKPKYPPCSHCKKSNHST